MALTNMPSISLLLRASGNEWGIVADDDVPHYYGTIRVVRRHST